MKSLCTIAQGFGKVRGTDGHDHEFLKIDAIVGMLSTVEDIHHRDGDAQCAESAHVGVKRKSGSKSRYPCYGHRHADDGVCAESLFVLGAIKQNHEAVDFGLVCRIHIDKDRSNNFINIGYGLQHAFASIAGPSPIP